MGTWHNPNPTEGAQVGWGHNSHTPQMRAVVHPLMPLREPQCAAPHTAPPPQSAPCPIATHHCSRSRCVTRCPHPAQRWLWAEPRVAAVWGGGGIGHRGAGLGYGMEGDASAHCAPRCDGGCGGDAVCGAQSCSGTTPTAPPGLWEGFFNGAGVPLEQGYSNLVRISHKLKAICTGAGTE